VRLEILYEHYILPFGIVELCNLKKNAMKIYLRDLQDGPLTVNLEGTEDWLQAVCQWFRAPKSVEVPRLTGNVTFNHAGDFVWVEGSFSYQPFVACDLCSHLVQINLSGAISRSYGLELPEFKEKEKDLKPGELDEFYLAGDHLDLGDMLNEVVQLALPAGNRHSSGHPECVPASEGGDVFWSSESPGEREADNPFAALKKLKLPAEP